MVNGCCCCVVVVAVADVPWLLDGLLDEVRNDRIRLEVILLLDEVCAPFNTLICVVELVFKRPAPVFSVPLETLANFVTDDCLLGSMPNLLVLNAFEF